MATVSPTPVPAGPIRRTSQRQALRRPASRQALARHDNQIAHGANASIISNGDRKQYNDDSSEDEIPVPMKLSALTKALLNDDGSEGAQHRGQSPPRTRLRSSALNTSGGSYAGEQRRHLRSGSVQGREVRGAKPVSPPRSRENSPARKRVVKLNHTPQSLGPIPPSKRHSASTSSSLRSRPQGWSSEGQEASAEIDQEHQQDVNTPAQTGRVVRIAVGSSGKRSRHGSMAPSSGRSNDRSAADRSAVEDAFDQSEAPDSVARNAPVVSIGSISRYASSSVRNRSEENTNLQGSMRVKRVGKLPGSFLSGPARRGRRRQSEDEDGEGIAEGDAVPSSQEPGSHRDLDRQASPRVEDAAHIFNSGSPVSGTAARAVHRRAVSNVDIRSGAVKPSPRRPLVDMDAEMEPQPMRVESVRSKPAPRPEVPSLHDQENEIPINLKRNKSSIDLGSSKKPLALRPLSADIAPAKVASPERKPLAAIAQNTPHRAAPPPPKMSLVETATAAGGAATTQAKQRRNILRVNGKCYTRLDCLGRGGSAKVYRVTAENGAMLALKRVSLDNADELQIRGYRGEIDLLRRLSKVDRVIELIDYEMNDEKRLLTLVMEMGELDLQKLIKERQDPEAAKFDPVFVRFYWKEMLECLKGVHECDVVHSDLKPANFVLVKGRLKLIDFGIANAIQDQTVNVHRENQVGTPNYMSPESLLDSTPRASRLQGCPRVVKVGRPSDVWSLGCILYQMVYGILPFGHIVNHMARCQAIINWDYAIEFPTRAMGGVPVPPSLMRTLKRCLARDQHMRPTVEELLHPTDPFLYPADLGAKELPINDVMLGNIIQNVVRRCRERMPTEAESANVWPQVYWASVKKSMANRM